MTRQNYIKRKQLRMNGVLFFNYRPKITAYFYLYSLFLKKRGLFWGGTFRHHLTVRSASMRRKMAMRMVKPQSELPP